MREVRCCEVAHFHFFNTFLSTFFLTFAIVITFLYE